MANSDKRIIFETDEGGIAIMIPSDNCGLTLEQIIHSGQIRGSY